MTLSPDEAADRLAIRELIEPTPTAPIAVTRTGRRPSSRRTPASSSTWAARARPSDDLSGRESLTPVFENLRTYDVTTHFNGQSTVTLDRDRATGESYCLAHHISSADGERTLMVASLRYLDTFVKVDGMWRFGEHRLHVDWIETRALDASRVP